MYNTEGEDGYEQKVCSFYPDGSGWKALTEGQYASILDGTKDGAYLCIRSYEDYSCFVTDGWSYPVYISDEQKDSLTQAAFAGHDLVMLCYEGEDRNRVYVMDPETGETTCRRTNSRSTGIRSSCRSSGTKKMTRSGWALRGMTAPRRCFPGMPW